MADPLTLSVMSQIARKAGWREPQPERAQEPQITVEPHLTERQGILLSELIHKKKTGACPVKPGTASQSSEGIMSLDALVKSAKTR